MSDLFTEYSVPAVVNEQLSRLVGKYPTTKPLSEIVRDLSLVVQFFEYKTKTDPYFYQPSNMSGNWLLPLVHRCLDLVPDDTSRMDHSELMVFEALRHATILFMQPVRRRFGINTGSCDQRVHKLRTILQESLALWDGNEALLRWIIVAASTEASAIEERLWFAAFLAAHEPFLETSEDEHLTALRSFIWKVDVFAVPVAEFLSQVEEIKLNSPIWPPSKSALRSHAMR